MYFKNQNHSLLTVKENTQTVWGHWFISGEVEFPFIQKVLNIEYCAFAKPQSFQNIISNKNDVLHPFEKSL